MDKMLDQKTLALVDKADGCQLLDELNLMPYDQRIGIANTVARVVNEMEGFPKITIETKTHDGWSQDADGEWQLKSHEHLVNVKCKDTDGNVKQIYQLPGTIGTRQIQGMTEEDILNKRLGLDDYNSEQIKNGNNGISSFSLLLKDVR